MSYQEVFLLFWEQVKISAQQNRFAKLTLAKTIGKPNLKNIFVRPLASDGEFKVLLKLSYRSKETEDIEKEMTLEEAFKELKPYLKTSFLTVLLFTTTKDVTLKINKKGAGTIIESEPTFSSVILAEKEI